VGVFLRTTFDLPTKVSIDAGDVGGPSAGMMFSLAIYDKLTPGALTGGAQIAGTGTINSAGRLGRSAASSRSCGSQEGWSRVVPGAGGQLRRGRGTHP
jgi:PDZ domain-containing protein